MELDEGRPEWLHEGWRPGSGMGSRCAKRCLHQGVVEPAGEGIITAFPSPGSC